jgi:hypothetical protein
VRREVWLEIIGYEDHYEISNFGNVRRHVNAMRTPGTSPGRIVIPSFTKGYPHVDLSKFGLSETHRVHTLVMYAFCGERPFPDAHICHNDGNPMNCHLTNLRWDSAYGNQADVKRHGNRVKGSNVFGSKLNEGVVKEIKELLKTGMTGKDISIKFDVSVSTISLIKLNKIWQHVQ